MQATINRIHDPVRAKAYFEDKLAFTTGPVELEGWIKTHEDNLVVVDVREREDYAKGHIPGSINLPHESWEGLRGLARNKTNVVYCYSQQCHLAAKACAYFAGKGFQVMEMEGGFTAWKQMELDVETEPVNRIKAGADRYATART